MSAVKFHCLFLGMMILLTVLTAPVFGETSRPDIEYSKWKTEYTQGEQEDIILECSFRKFEINMPENEAVAAKVNASISALEQDWIAKCGEDLKSQQQSWREVMLAGEEWQYYHQEQIGKEITTARMDETVLSFPMIETWYGGGAHGMYWITGITFDARTGEQLTLADLSSEPEKTRETCVEKIAEKLTEPDFWTNNDEESRSAAEVIVDRDSWYLIDEGIVFRAIPYEVTAYAGGAVEFIVPYSELPELRY